MNVKVYYVSPKNCAQDVAEVIARECRCTKEPLMPAYPPENVALMFLGFEGTKIDKVTAEFLPSLNKIRVHNAAIFSCNAKMDSSILDEVRKDLEGRGINVVSSMVFPGKGFMSGKKPGPDDLEKAKKFAQDAMAAIK